MFPALENPAGQLYDQIQLTGLQLNCVVGLYPKERRKKQPVRIDLGLYCDTRKAAGSTHLQDTVDYARTVAELEFLLENSRFQLLETAAEALCKFLLAPRFSSKTPPEVHGVFLRLSKPRALLHGVVPTIQVLRKRGDFIWQDDGQVMDIHLSKDCHIQQLALDAGQTIELQASPEKERAIFAAGKIGIKNTVLNPGSAVVGAIGALELHGVENVRTNAVMIETPRKNLEHDLEGADLNVRNYQARWV